ncbi:hypothetical protein OIU78_013110 [Salix suchowensis]|nr:hypothetical protein OIU78_013110 [Salix suchowensis]
MPRGSPLCPRISSWPAGLEGRGLNCKTFPD